MTNRIANIKGTYVHRLFSICSSACEHKFIGKRTFVLRNMLLLLMVMGVNGMWGQTGEDYSGIFYFVNCGSGKNGDPTIANITNADNYFYLVPADNPQLDNKRDAWFSSDYSKANGDSEKPYLTTVRTKKDAAEVPEGVTNRPHNSVWIVKFASTDSGTDYYYLIHAATGKYVVYDPPYSDKNNRKSMHLLTTDSPGENAKFAITIHSNNYNFRPKSIGTGASTNKYLNAAQQNYTAYYSSDEYVDGDADYFRGLVGLWKESGNGSDWMKEETLLPAPTINYNSEANTFTITYDQLPEGYDILYTTDDSDPTLGGNSTKKYSSAIPVEGNNTIKAAVVRYDMILTEIASAKLVLNPTVTLAENEYTYDGSAKEPAVSSVKDGETVISSDEYRIEYQDNVNVGSATVLINNKTGGSYIVYGSATFTIHPKAVTITANDASKPYDGTALTEDGFTNTALETDDTHTFTVVMTEESAITNVGSQPNVIETVDGVAVTTGTETAVGNYLVTTANGTLVVNQKNIGDGTLTDGFTLSIDEDNNIVITYDATGRTLELSTDYTIGSESTSGKYSTRTILGAGNYSGSFSVKNAIAHFTTDADQAEWSATFVAESSDVADIGHVLPEGISAFIISGIQGEWAIPEPLNYIPAGVPVLLVSHEEKNGFFVMDAHSDDVTLITEGQKTYNKLKEVTEESVHFNNREIYLLYKNEFVLNKDGDLGEGKVYVENPNYHDPSSAPARLSIAWGNVTGIGAVLNDNGEMRNDNWYTLDGRKLIGKPTTKGLYIVGGKKIVIK